jgi:hypothetical protein
MTRTPASRRRTRPLANETPSIDIRELKRDGLVVFPHSEVRTGSGNTTIEWSSWGFGGRRPWLLCPICSKRKLVLWVNSDHLECKLCLRVAYPSQSEDAAARAVRRSVRLRRRLGCEAHWGAPVQKPRTARWETFLLLSSKIAEAEGVCVRDLELLDHRGRPVRYL